ncbi:hypothetical protein ACAG24_000260 [Mycobacterium sp. pW049]|uniref:hypothetical protein n=1 Tax=[Mycobacterium] bulgaricum TaxID=3238985 RepID=UPI00351AB42F
MIGRRLRTAWGEFVGPETGPAGTAVILGFAGVGAAAAPRFAASLSTAESVLLRLCALDLWGGAVANNTRACARWYERPGQTDSHHLQFAAMHLHPALLAWMDRRESGRVPPWVWATAQYGYLIAATVAIRRAARWRRPLGLVLTAGGIALDAGLGRSQAAPWFGPVFYAKLLLGHAAGALWSEADLRGIAKVVPPTGIRPKQAGGSG